MNAVKAIILTFALFVIYIVPTVWMLTETNNKISVPLILLAINSTILFVVFANWFSNWFKSKLK